MRCGKWKKSLGIFLSSILLLGTVFSHVAWAGDNLRETANDTVIEENGAAGTEESMNIDAAHTKSIQQSTEAGTTETAGDEVDTGNSQSVTSPGDNGTIDNNVSDTGTIDNTASGNTENTVSDNTTENTADSDNTQNSEGSSQPGDTQESSNTENNETTDGQEPAEETNQKEDVENMGDNQNTEASDTPTEVLEESQQLFAASAAQAVSASSFLLRWGNWGDDSATNSVEIHYVDPSGKPLKVRTETTQKVDGDAKVTLSDYATRIPNYTYHVARLESQMGDNISYLRRNDWKIQYSSNDADYSTWEKGNILQVYLIYSATTENTLSTVETIDSKELGVEMTVFDYDELPFSIKIGKYGDGSVTQGLLKRKLDEEGYPVLKDGSALKTAFDKKMAMLLKQSMPITFSSNLPMLRTRRFTIAVLRIMQD
ncbi:MAG: hypothetical protein PHS82_14035 [Lachnospiraceae bacterium]|nr:hypothetical protein [Lachnospiraceae bacterium]